MASNNHMHNFTTLMKRLEAATSRLEDMANTFDGASSTPVGGANTEDASSEAPTKPAPSEAPSAPEALPPSIQAFDALINNQVKKFVGISEELGGPVAAQSKAVLHSFGAVRTFIFVSTKAKKPEPLPADLLTDLHVTSDEINNLRESNRASPQFTQLSTVAEAAVAMGWLFESKPPEFIKEVFPAAQFYGNRVLNEYKDKDDLQVAYIQTFYDVMKAAIQFTTDFFPRGLTWNPDGVDVIEAINQVKQQDQKQAQPGTSTLAGAAAAPPPPPPLPNFDLSGGAPPPPPPPPPGGAPAPKSGGAPDMSAVFEQLNQGSAVTSNLRKVDKSEMTHKNPSLRASSTVPERSDSQNSSKSPTRGKSPAPVPGKKPKPENLRAKKIPRKHLDGNKWFIEHYESPEEVIEISAQISQSILVSRCHKAILKVNNKANAIQVDNCTELSIIVDSLVSSIEIIKAPKFALQIDGTVPTIVMDQVDGATIYLSKDSLNTELFTSKCTATNIVLPPENDADDSKECPLPEQIRSSIKNGEVVSEIVDHAG